MAHVLTSLDTLPTVPAGSPARLTRQHFALYRGYLDGVSEAQLHASYGDTSGDVRSTRRLIAVLRDTLSVLARRAHDTEAAHLLRLRPGSIPDLDASVRSVAPTLEDFRQRVDPDGVFGESELLDLYREAYPPEASPSSDRRAARNARLRGRQAEALARMEASLVQDPKQDHPVDGWFEPAVAARLSAAGLETIGDVLALIETKRHRWYTSVPRLGPKGAQRVIDWIRLHESALGHTVSQRAIIPRRQWAEGTPTPVIADESVVAPLERLLVPATLDGSKGTNRADNSGRASFDTDIRAVTAWLDARSASEHTRRAYRREAERLLLWALVEKRKPLSSLDHDDCAEYITAFLADPQPAARWVATGRLERCFAAWRPFAGPLSDRSRESARSILGAMFEWLIDANYLANNPMLGLERASTPPAIDPQGRTLDLEQWNFVLASTEREAYTFAEHRDRLALLLAYSTGLRRAELAAATTDALSADRLAGVSGSVWRLSVGDEPRSVLLAPAVMEALRDNLSMRGLPEPLACPDGTPILAQARGGLDMTPDGIGKLFKRIFTSAGAQLDAISPGAGRRLTQASTHWLRHTHSSHALAHGAALRDVSASLGHATVATTSLYLRHEDAGRYLGIEALIRASSAAKKTGK
jgi:site-specific recombinase XerD